MNLNAYDPHKMKWIKVGTIKDDVLYKKVLPVHFFRRANGYGIQYDIFDKVMKLKKVVIIEQNGNKWEATPLQWFTNGKVLDYGWGKQLFLSLKYMSLQKAKLNADLSPNLDKSGDVWARLSEEFRRKYK